MVLGKQGEGFRPKILMADDEEKVRMLLGDVLTDEGYDVAMAGDGEEALRKVRENNFMAVLVDVKMRGLNGIDFLRTVKQANAYLPIILITGFASLETAISATKFDAYDYIIKPFDLNEIKMVVRKAVRKYQLEMGNKKEFQMLKQKKIKLERDAKELNKKVCRLSILSDVGYEIISSLDLKAVLNRILETSFRMLKADAGSLMLFQGKGGALIIKVAEGLDKEMNRSITAKAGETISHWVAKNKKPLFLTHGLKDDRRFPRLDGEEKIRSALSVPLMIKDRMVGVLNLNRIKDTADFTKTDLELAAAFTNQAAVAVENAVLYEQLMRSKQKLERANRELKRTYKQLIKSERLAAIGQLAMGAAHQLRNPLGVIGVGMHNLKSGLDNMGTREREQITLIERQLDHAGRIISDLLSFAGKTAGKVTEVDLNLILDDAVSVIADRASLKQVGLTKKLASHLLKIKGDVVQLEQAFSNIMVNALEAMSEGGMLTISTKNIKSKKSIEIRITDTGQGIAQDDIEKVFDPFFTTKDDGVGLGLSIAYGIIDRHGGSIDLKSQEGKGTSFAIKLPVNQK